LSASVGDSTVLDELAKKHPAPSPDALVEPDAPLLDCSHPVIFDCLDERVIRSTVLHVDGATLLNMFHLCPPLLKKRLFGLAHQVWYADNAAAGGGILQLRKWWSCLSSSGHHLGYFTNARKTWLVVKQEHLEHAQDIFAGTGIQITSTGRPYLGAALGSTQLTQEYAAQCVGKWTESDSLFGLVSFAQTQPHASYSAFTHGFSSKWTFFLRTTPGIAECFLPLEQVICHHFLPSLVSHSPNDVEWSLFALPAHVGGLGIFNPCAIAAETYQFCRHVADPIVECILNRHSALSPHILNEQHSIFQDLTRSKHYALTDTIKSIYDQCSPDLQYIIDCLQERGSSSWLTSLPIEQHRFVLHKGDFIDTLCLRYGWMPPRLPSHCVCGTDFSISHAFSCLTVPVPPSAIITSVI